MAAHQYFSFSESHFSQENFSFPFAVRHLAVWLCLGQQQQRPCIGYITEQASLTTEMTLISLTEHGKEELGWRRVVSKLAEEAARVGRLESNQLIYQLSKSISQFGNNAWVAKSPDCMGTKPLNSIMLSGKQTFEIMGNLQDRLIMFQVCFKTIVRCQYVHCML